MRQTSSKSGKLPGKSASSLQKPKSKKATSKKRVPASQTRRGRQKAPGDTVPVSPLAPKTMPDMPSLGGVTLATGRTGLKYRGRDDVLLVALEEGTTAAGTFTTSKMPGAPVEWCKAQLEKGTARGLVVNAGNANVFTGKAGMASVRATASAAAQSIGCRQKDIFIASTGVIGEWLDPAPLEKAVNQASKKLSPDGWAAAARAIMTTDTFAKFATRQVMIGDVPVLLHGICKGSGMVAPDLATMLAYIFTDAAIPAPVLQTLLVLGVRDSFNAITVDSDTSTSDMLMLFATGDAQRRHAAETGQEVAPVRRVGDPRLRAFRQALHELMLELAHLVVKDGEGARKFIKVSVSGAASSQGAKRIALAVANSPLVKTAIGGEDANWGRIVMAVGKAGEAANRDRLKICIGGIEIARNGVAVPDYREAPVARHLKGDEIDLAIDVGVGTAQAAVWTCDLTQGYIRINGSYRS